MERKNAIKIYFGYFLLLISFLILFSSRSFGAEVINYFPMQQNENNNIPENYYTIFDQYLDTENNFVVIRNGEVFSDGLGFWYVKYPKNANYGIYGEINNAMTHFTLYNVGANSSYENGRISITYNGDVYHNIYQQNAFTNFTNVPSSNYSDSISYISNFQIMTNSGEVANIVLLYDDGVTIPDDDTARQDMEKPDADDYFPDWTNKPTFDNSTVENALSSLFDIVDWGWNNIKNTIKGLGEFITDSMRWGMQKIIDTIRNKVDEIKNAVIDKMGDIWYEIVNVGDAIVDLGDTLGNVYDFFANPWNSSDFDYTLEHSDFYAIYTSIGDSLDSINDTIDSVNEPESFVIRYSTGFHPDNESGFHFPTIEGEISFDWLIPLRTYYRPILWLVVVYEMVVYGFSTFGDVLQGRTGAK